MRGEEKRIDETSDCEADSHTVWKYTMTMSKVMCNNSKGEKVSFAVKSRKSSK